MVSLHQPAAHHGRYRNHLTQTSDVRIPGYHRRMETAPVPSSPLRDRERELSVISAAITAARSGSGTALIVEGPAGIGKTSLLAHAGRQAAADGMTVLAARAAEFEGGYAWGVTRQLFESAVRSGAAELMTDSVVALAAPALSQAGSHGEQDAFAILHGLYWLVAGLAQRGPLFVAVDDLHWADQPSQRFVAHLVRRLEGLPVLLMVTIREPRSGTAQEKALTAGLAAERGVTVLQPGAISGQACAELVGEALGDTASPAFRDTCREITGGNPLLLHALLAELAAEGVAGTDADVAHLRRLTPTVVSRSVLLQLGRMPAEALMAARGVAILGTAATTARAGRLVGLDPDVSADAVAALMAEHLVEGEHAVQFVHPLVRSVVYEDIAPPVRKRWHYRAARMLDDEGATPEEVTVHLLASDPSGDPWVVARLRSAAEDARARGAADVAALCLERALAEPPSAGERPDMLLQLGTALIAHAPAQACEHLADALAATEGARRSQVALALGEAMTLSGRITDAVRVLQAAIEERSGEAGATDELEAALLNTARWDLETRPLTPPLVERLKARAAGGEDLDPQLHANLAIELAAAGADREQAVYHAREAVRALPRMMSVTATALPEAISVLLFADLSSEAQERSQSWLELAQQRGWPLASAVAATAAMLTALYDGDVSDALAYGEQALAAGAGWIPVITVGFLVRALVNRGALDEARALLAEHNLDGDLGPIWPYNVVRHARGCLHAAAGDHAAACADLLVSGELATNYGISNPVMFPWGSDAVPSLSALGEHQRARELAAETLTLARRWGTSRAVGVALRTVALVGDADRSVELLTEATEVLRRSPARLELARALVDLGAACRRGGLVSQARVHLRDGLDLAHELGALTLADRAREELITAGGRPRRDAIRGRDALTPSELRVAQLAAAGQTNRQIAQALFVTRRTVETHLTSSYEKLGIRSRSELAAALGDGHAVLAG
jgi:DNA-binding CsgD family transcriptional regulator